MFTEPESHDTEAESDVAEPERAAAYPKLTALAQPLKKMERTLVGREKEQDQVLATLLRPELSNCLLLGDAGSGKTSLVQGVMENDPDRLYLEVDLPKMISTAGTAEHMAAELKAFFDEAEDFVISEERELVLFIDEFHQIVQLSDSAVEAVKPVLAASGTRGIRIIAATTYVEFHKHIAQNLPLVERLQRINLSPPDKKTTIEILKGMAAHYGVADQFVDDFLFHQIYDYTNRYMPASSQPRKSILVLDSMVGWHRLTKRPMGWDLLVDVLAESLGVNVAFKVDGAKIKQELDGRVLSQDLATTEVAKRLQLSVADLHDKTRPSGSFLFAGSSGVGKTELTKALAHVLFGDDQRHLIRMDMTEYASASSLEAFRSELTQKVWNLPHSVILLDEVEKAHASITRILLQVLDDGRLSDDHGRQVSFLNSYIVLTTNSGSEIFENIGQYAADDTGSGEQLEDYDKLIRRSIIDSSEGNGFPPELLGRIDVIVPFQPLSRPTQGRIITHKILLMCREVLHKHRVTVTVDDRVATYLIEDKADTDTNAGGARAAVARLTRDVTTKVAQFINENPGVSAIRVDVVGQLVSENQGIRKSNATIEVSVDAR